MVVVPVLTGVTIPDDVPIVATPVELLDHVPPAVTSVNVIVDPIQTRKRPPPETRMGAGKGLTVTTCVAAQPLGYE